jgi:hypothetical protein
LSCEPRVFSRARDYSLLEPSAIHPYIQVGYETPDEESAGCGLPNNRSRSLLWIYKGKTYQWNCKATMFAFFTASCSSSASTYLLRNSEGLSLAKALVTLSYDFRKVID